MDDFEAALRRGLTNVDAGYTPSADLPARITTRTRRRVTQRRIAFGAAAVAAAIALALGLSASLGVTTSSHYPTHQADRGPSKRRGGSVPGRPGSGGTFVVPNPGAPSTGTARAPGQAQPTTPG